MDNNDQSPTSVLDSELLSQMAEAHAAPTRAAEAWEEFYRRHYDYLMNVCKSSYSLQIGEGRVPEVVQDSFVKAFRKAGTFRSTAGQSGEESRWHVRGWLGSILQNTVRDLYRQEPHEVFTEDIELFADNEQEESNDRCTPREWYRFLNRHVFFWVSESRVKVLLQARAYRTKEHLVLTVDTALLLQAYRKTALLSPINSGSTIYRPVERSLDTFASLSNYPFAARRRMRGVANAVAELTIPYAVPDISKFVVKAEIRKGTDILQKLRLH